MRRKRTSWRPALVSYNHFPPLFTRGMGSGQSSLPTEMVARLEFVGSRATSCFSRALAANAMALFLSWTGSSEDTKSSPPGPRISLRAGRSKFSAAKNSAAAASSGVANPFCAGWDGLVVWCSDFCACGYATEVQNKTTGKSAWKILNRCTAGIDMMYFSLFIGGLPPPSAATRAAHTGCAA
jgi:hypothetical protein